MLSLPLDNDKHNMGAGMDMDTDMDTDMDIMDVSGPGEEALQA